MLFEKLIARHGLPHGYRRATQADLVPETTIWLWGTHDGKAKAYGPHTYVRAADIPGLLRLRNPKGREFNDRLEHLLIPEPEPAHCTSDLGPDPSYRKDP